MRKINLLIIFCLGFPVSANSRLIERGGGDLESHVVCISNERSGDVTIFRGGDGDVLATIPVGKRPRGIHASPDGRFLYVALSGSPISGPLLLDAKGNPIFREEDEEDADHSADGIGVIDLRRRMFLRKLPSGSDP